MGLVASQARYMMLVALKSDVDMQTQATNQARMALASMVGRLVDLRMNLDPDSHQAMALQRRIEIVQQMDKRLELMNKNDYLAQAIQTEMTAVQKVIDKNLNYSFKTFA